MTDANLRGRPLRDMIRLLRAGSWKSIHRLTWLVVLSLGGFGGYCQFFYPRLAGTTYEHGIPAPYSIAWNCLPQGPYDVIRWKVVAYDAAWWLLLVFGPAVLCETWCRQRFQFSLKFLLTLPLALAVLLPFADLRFVISGLLHYPCDQLLEFVFSFSSLCWLLILFWLVGEILAFGFRTEAQAGMRWMPFGTRSPMHPVTWLVFLAEGWLWGRLQFFASSEFVSETQLLYVCGFPLSYTECDYSSSGPCVPTFAWTALLYDVIWWLILVLGPVSLCETWSRRRFRLSARFLLLLPLTLTALASDDRTHVWFGLFGFPKRAFPYFPAAFSVICWVPVVIWLARKAIAIRQRSKERERSGERRCLRESHLGAAGGADMQDRTMI